MVDPVDLAKKLKALRENLPAVKDSQMLEAEIKKHQFDALVKQGFTPEQALAIVIGTK